MTCGLKTVRRSRMLLSAMIAAACLGSQGNEPETKVQQYPYFCVTDCAESMSNHSRPGLARKLDESKECRILAMDKIHSSSNQLVDWTRL
jgi:hypothetical protein